MPGFNSSNTFKIFIGKIPEKTTVQDIQPLFENYGKVVECDVVKNYGFVHMENSSAGYEAIRNLNGSVVNGSAITVEEAKNKKRQSATTTKLFVGNIAENVKAADIRALFSKYGSVAECDLVRNYGFVHIDTTDLTTLMKEMNGYELEGQQLKVQISTSRIRQRPGMGNPQQCYKCGLSGHWSKECTQSPSAVAPGQAHYLQDPMHGVPRTAYPREYYAQAMPSGPYVRERILSYSQPDMREYYDHFCQNSMERFSDYAAISNRRDVYSSATGRVPTATEYEAIGRRSPNTNIAHYPADGRTYSEYGGVVSYTYGNETCYGYGDYTTAACGPTATADQYAVDGRLYQDYNAATRNVYADERRSDRRDGTSRTSSRYAPY